MKGEGDLHSKKSSHISIPITKGMETHLTGKDINKDGPIGEKVNIVTPMVRTSKDNSGGMPHQRFKQIEKTYIGDQSSKPPLRGVTHRGD